MTMNVPHVVTEHFSVAAPAGEDDLPGLLRAAADRLEGIEDVSVRDIVVCPAQNRHDVASVRVYYARLGA